MKELSRRLAPLIRDLAAAGQGQPAPSAAAGAMASPEQLAGPLLALAYLDRVAQLQAGKENVFALSNGRGAALGNSNDPLATSSYLVAAQLDGAEKRSARIFLAAPSTLPELWSVLGAAVTTADEVFVVPSDGSVRARRVERIGSLVLREPLAAPPRQQTRGYCSRREIAGSA